MTQLQKEIHKVLWQVIESGATSPYSAEVKILALITAHLEEVAVKVEAGKKTSNNFGGGRNRPTVSPLETYNAAITDAAALIRKSAEI